MATVSALQPSRVPSPEIIDVDALEELEEEGVVFTGFHGHPRQLPPPRPSAGPSSVAHHPTNDEATLPGFRRRSPRRAPRMSRSAQAGPSNSSAAGPSEVIVVDSDEEEPSTSSRIRRRSFRVGPRPRLMSPPPPVAQRGHTPGVPPLPRHLASQASLHRRSRAADVPPPIRPVSQPLAFEAGLLPIPPPPPFPANFPLPLDAAPRSHHQPSMGFGGAMIALNRQNTLQEASRANQARERAPRGFNLPTFTEMFRRMTGYAGEEDDIPARPENPSRSWRNRVMPWYWEDAVADPERELFSPFGNEDAWFGLPDRLDALRPVVGRNPYIPKAETVPMWKPEYTHPNKIAPGFTHDFAAPDDPATQTSGSSSPQTVIVLDDEAGPSSGAASGSSSATAVETTLVCARCLDPLVLAPADGSSEEDVKSRRVWALRCGHMLDGKCVAALMFPPTATADPGSTESPQEDEASVRSKGKGKARADPEPPAAPLEEQPIPTAEVDAAPADRKGKRKAVEPLEPSESPKRAALAAPGEPADADAGSNSIRSRLRSRTRAAADVSPSSASAAGPGAHVMPADGLFPTTPPRGGRRRPGAFSRRAQQHGDESARARGKGKGRAAKVERTRVVEAEHEWRCSVAGCGCVHYSVRVEGVWVNDEGRGPIALFV